MGNVTDVSSAEGRDAAVLTATSAGGLLGGRLLNDDPLAAYLSDVEQAQYVLRNKKKGLVVERDGTVETIGPDADCQALCAVTDVRLVAVVGQSPHDESVSIPLSEIVSVEVDDGVLGGELAVVTGAEERYAFPCRGDLGPVASYVDEGTQAWARAYTLLDRAEDALADARTDSERALFDDAIDAVDAAQEAVADATDRLAAFGEGAMAALEGEVTELEERIEDRRRAVHVAHGKHAHQRAREDWEQREYDAAYDRYAEAEDAIERAMAIEEDAEVAERLSRLRKEWGNLKVAPVAYAEAMAEEARDTDRPGTAAQCWEVAMQRYRDVYALDWGRENERFDANKEGVRERILETLENAIDCRIEAARSARSDAADLHEEGATVAARDRLETALAGLERASDLVAELRQERDPDLEAERAAVEEALADLDAAAAASA